MWIILLSIYGIGKRFFENIKAKFMHRVAVIDIERDQAGRLMGSFIYRAGRERERSLPGKLCAWQG